MKLALLLNDPVIVNRDKCSCGGKLRVDKRTSRFICNSCGHQSIYTAEDCERSASNHRSDRKVSDSSSSYLLFLRQFSENVTDPPDNIMQLLLSSIDSIHGKVSHTDVEKILVKNKYNTWAKFNYRFARILNNEPVPVFTEQLIKKLEMRYCRIKTAFEQTRSAGRKKMPNFITALKTTLTMEGEYELSNQFHNNKGKSIVLAEEERIRKCCRLIEKQDKNDINWKFKPLS